MERWAESDWKLPVISGLLLAAAYLLPLLVPNFICFIPLLFWLDFRIDDGRWSRIKAGLIFGLVTYLIGLGFMPIAMTDYSWLAIPLYIGFALLLALRVALSMALLGWLRRATGLSYGLLLPVCWLPFEYIQTFGDLRMTGEHLSNSLACHPFVIQFAELVGHYGVGAFMLAVNGLLLETLFRWKRESGKRSAAALALLLVLAFGYDGWAWTRPVPPGETLQVALIQPNIPLPVKMTRGTEAEQWRQLADLSRQAAGEGAELIVWPETAWPGTMYHFLDHPDTYALPDVQALATALETPFLVGAEYVRVRRGKPHELYNAAMVVEASGALSPVWSAKIYLVPFVEATPFKSLLGPLVEGKPGEWRWLAGGFTPGPRETLLEANGTRIGVLVCYEEMFAELARDLRNAGAELQVVITNDAWFGRTRFQTYQADILRMRAIENRSAFVRVANTGISGFVDRRGRYHRMTGLFEEAVEVETVHLSSGRTVYNRLGDAIMIPVLLGLAWALYSTRRQAGSELR
jgi:apolipoprotein N-acyltransferase